MRWQERNVRGCEPLLACGMRERGLAFEHLEPGETPGRHFERHGRARPEHPPVQQNVAAPHTLLGQQPLARHVVAERLGGDALDVDDKGHGR